VVTRRRRAPLAAGGSVSLAPVSFSVKPGVSYQLTVAIVLPAGQTDTTGTSLTELLQIAPN
jgi:lipoprotein-anchoring transpeptidase ErfK/SrfK